MHLRRRLWGEGRHRRSCPAPARRARCRPGEEVKPGISPSKARGPRLALHPPVQPGLGGRRRPRGAQARQCHGQGRRLRHAVTPAGQARLSVASRGRRLALGGVTADCAGPGEDPTPSLPGRHDVTQRSPSPLFSSIWVIRPAAQHDDPARNSTARVIGALTGRTRRAQPRGAARPADNQTRSAGPAAAADRGHYVANRDGQDHQPCMGGGVDPGRGISSPHQPGHPGSGRGRPSCTRPRPRSSSLSSPESERPGPEDSQPRLPAEYPRPGNPQATGQRRKPNSALSPIGATYAAQPSISAGLRAFSLTFFVTQRDAIC